MFPIEMICSSSLPSASFCLTLGFLPPQMLYIAAMDGKLARDVPLISFVIRIMQLAVDGRQMLRDSSYRYGSLGFVVIMGILEAVLVCCRPPAACRTHLVAHLLSALSPAVHTIHWTSRINSLWSTV